MATQIVDVNNAITALQAAAQACMTLTMDETVNPNYDVPLSSINTAITALNNIANGLPALPDSV